MLTIVARMDEQLKYALRELREREAELREAIAQLENESIADMTARAGAGVDRHVEASAHALERLEQESNRAVVQAHKLAASAEKRLDDSRDAYEASRSQLQTAAWLANGPTAAFADVAGVETLAHQPYAMPSTFVTPFVQAGPVHVPSHGLVTDATPSLQLSSFSLPRMCSFGATPNVVRFALRDENDAEFGPGFVEYVIALELQANGVSVEPATLRVTEHNIYFSVKHADVAGADALHAVIRVQGAPFVEWDLAILPPAYALQKCGDADAERLSTLVAPEFRSSGQYHELMKRPVTAEDIVSFWVSVENLPRARRFLTSALNWYGIGHEVKSLDMYGNILGWFELFQLSPTGEFAEVQVHEEVLQRTNQVHIMVRQARESGLRPFMNALGAVIQAVMQAESIDAAWAACPAVLVLEPKAAYDDPPDDGSGLPEEDVVSAMSAVTNGWIVEAEKGILAWIRLSGAPNGIAKLRRLSAERRDQLIAAVRAVMERHSLNVVTTKIQGTIVLERLGVHVDIDSVEFRRGLLALYVNALRSFLEKERDA